MAAARRDYYEHFRPTLAMRGDPSRPARPERGPSSLIQPCYHIRPRCQGAFDATPFAERYAAMASYGLFTAMTGFPQTGLRLLGLIGIDADPVKSREHILLSTILDTAWRANQDLDLALLIQQVQAPPISKVGVLDLETFYLPARRLNTNYLIAKGSSSRDELVTTVESILGELGFEWQGNSAGEGAL